MTTRQPESEPPAARWIGRYLAVIVAGMTFVSTLIALLIAATLALSNANHTIGDHDKLFKEMKEVQKQLQADVLKGDQRLNDQAVKIAVLEEQIKLFAGRTVLPPSKGSEQ